MPRPGEMNDRTVNPCEGCKHDQCEFCTDLEYQAGMDKFFHFVQSHRREGETFLEAESRLRRTTTGGTQ